MTSEEKILADLSLAKKLQDDKLIIDGLLIAMMVCRRHSMSKYSRDVQKIMENLNICVKKISEGTFDYPAFVEKEFE
jgi:hypothetical protein